MDLYQILTYSLSVITLVLAVFSFGMFKRFKKVDTWVDPKTDIKVELEPVYKDKFGNNWYQYKDPRHIPYTRAVVAEIATKQSELNMTKENLIESFQICETLANNGQITKMFSVFENIRERLTWACHEETLKGVALVYFVLEGEDPTVYSDEWGEKKKAIFEADSEARYFFLTGAYKIITGLSNVSENDIQGYLATKLKLKV